MDMDIADNWTPTSANINALPEPIRLYVHDLETNCDHTGNVQTIACLRENQAALESIIANQQPIKFA